MTETSERISRQCSGNYWNFFPFTWDKLVAHLAVSMLTRADSDLDQNLQGEKGIILESK